jgi:CrcB protein
VGTIAPETYAIIAAPMVRLLWVCFAGAIGTGVRYVVWLAAGRVLGITFPWGTLIVNVVGCFFMSIVAYAGAKAVISPDLRITLATGFLGGLTTYSAFNWDTLSLVQNGPAAVGLVNLAVTLVSCMIAGIGGLAVARAFF